MGNDDADIGTGLSYKQAATSVILTGYGSVIAVAEATKEALLNKIVDPNLGMSFWPKYCRLYSTTGSLEAILIIHTLHLAHTSSSILCSYFRTSIP